MSISLKVVSEAAAFCDCFKRSAIRFRIAFILTLRSVRLPGCGLGSEVAGEGLEEEDLLDSALGCLGSDAFGDGRFGSCSFTATSELDCLRDEVSFSLAVGSGCALSLPLSREAGAFLGGAAAHHVNHSAGSRAGNFVNLQPAGASLYKSCPTLTVSSSCAKISTMTPAFGALMVTSIYSIALFALEMFTPLKSHCTPTLSVSMDAISSSASTWSPTFFIQVFRVPSDMDSAICGTLIVSASPEGAGVLDSPLPSEPSALLPLLLDSEPSASC